MRVIAAVAGGALGGAVAMLILIIAANLLVPGLVSDEGFLVLILVGGLLGIGHELKEVWLL